jgi:hypothetical protein
VSGEFSILRTEAEDKQVPIPILGVIAVEQVEGSRFVGSYLDNGALEHELRFGECPKLFRPRRSGDCCCGKGDAEEVSNGMHGVSSLQGAVSHGGRRSRVESFMILIEIH